jgi:AhpD family alkylhydroperoxidase
MSMTVKERELVNIGASVATGCKPCTDYHFEKSREAGATDEEIKQAITDALAVRDSARGIMETHGLQHLGLSKACEEEAPETHTTRIKELVSIGAAFAVNCTSNLERHINASRSVGVDEDDVTAVLEAVDFIKGEAAHYAGQLVRLEEKYDQLQQLLAELRETQAQLVQTEKVAALGKLVAGVVHELNTPVGCLKSAIDVSSRAITNILDVLTRSRTLDEARSSERLRRSLDVIESNAPLTQEACQRISRIVSSLKNFTRLDEATLQEADIHDGLESTVTLLEHELKDRIEVVTQFGDIPRLRCYPADLNQVFMNLLSNAAQAIEDQGTITIRTVAQDGTVRVSISDTGVGIDPEELKGLFDAGFTKKGDRVRAGMGLLVASNIVTSHHGRIEVESEPGSGSTFTVVLPIDANAKPESREVTGRAASVQRRDPLGDVRTPPESEERVSASAHRCDRLAKDLHGESRR